MTVDAGTRLNDRYVLTSRIATGGMGEVWNARDELLARDVAVKLLKREYAEDAAFLERFRAEARHTAGLAHPGIAGVFDYGEVEGNAYLVMELVRGEPLSAVIAAGGGPMAPDRALDITAQAARALEAAHQGGVIHRDVKPGNILVCPDGVVKITDFGIARAADAVPLTQTGVVMGTAHYVSPEQANGKAVTFASDVYSLGVVLYECLAGRRPFEADTPVGIAMAHIYEDPLALPESVPESVQTLVARAMAKDPADRFPSAASFAQAADAVRGGLDGTDVATVAVGVPAVAATMALPATEEPVAAPRTRAVAERRKTSAMPWLVAAGVVLVLLLGAVVWSATRPAPEVAVPKLSGLTKAAAVAALERRKLDVVEKTAYSDSVRRGSVIKQDPPAGETVRQGDDVTVTISRGPQPVRLPSGLQGKRTDEVVRTLEGLGLKVRQAGAVSTEPFGTVIAVAPTTDLSKGDTVTVTSSLGLPREGKDDEKGGGKKDDEKDKGDD